jgi:ribosome maturation factor RimP
LEFRQTEGERPERVGKPLVGLIEKAVDSAEKIQQLIAPVVEALGFELVRVSFTGTGRRILQIMAERPDGSMNVDDCAIISREISVLLDVEDAVRGEYFLEVSSPGVERPLTRPKDFTRYAGHDAKVESRVAIDGQRRFKGRLLGLVGDDVVVRTAEGEVAVPLADVIKAKLLFSDAAPENGPGEGNDGMKEDPGHAA